MELIFSAINFIPFFSKFKITIYYAFQLAKQKHS